jgi:hypothetical protein
LEEWSSPGHGDVDDVEVHGGMEDIGDFLEKVLECALREDIHAA